MKDNSPSDKRILVLTENFPPISGGSGRWFWELYSRLPREQVLIVANQHNDATSHDAKIDTRVIRIPFACSEWGFKSVLGIKFYWRTVKTLREIVKRHNINEIHCGRVLHEGVSAWLLRLFFGIPYICFVHGEDVETAATSREQSLMVKQICKGAQYLVCNSQNSAGIVKRLNYAEDEKLHVLNPGVDAQRFSPSSVSSDFRTKMQWIGQNVVLTVGRLQERKGQDKMIEAMPEILKVHPNVIYVIVGDGDRLEQLKKQTERLNLQAHVQFFTDLSDGDMIQCYQNCDLFILPNRTVGYDIEGFGMVLVEAQSCGKPVIAGDSGGTRETMLVNETGLVIDCTQSENIARSVNNILAQPDLMIKMGDKGREHVVSNLDWQAHSEKARTLFGLS